MPHWPVHPQGLASTSLGTLCGLPIPVFSRYLPTLTGLLHIWVLFDSLSYLPLIFSVSFALSPQNYILLKPTWGILDYIFADILIMRSIHEYVCHLGQYNSSSLQGLIRVGQGYWPIHSHPQIHGVLSPLSAWASLNLEQPKWLLFHWWTNLLAIFFSFTQVISGFFCITPQHAWTLVQQPHQMLARPPLGRLGQKSTTSSEKPPSSPADQRCLRYMSVVWASSLGS